MSKPKSTRIPRPYRKPLKKRKFESILAALADDTERTAVQEAFLDTGDGRVQFSELGDARRGKEIARILKGVHKARRGPRTMRLVIVMLIVGLPILLNLLFLDFLAARELERRLESMMRTDIGVVNLDIAPLRGRISLDELSFASRSDPMIDEWRFDGIALDFNVASALRRRFIVDALTGNAVRNAPRRVPAEYPVIDSGIENGKGEPSSETSGRDGATGFEWMPINDLPTASIDEADRLRDEAEAEWNAWSEGMERRIAESETLMNDVGRFLDEPAPARTDITAWTDRINRGRVLMNRLNDLEQAIGEDRQQLAASARKARDAASRARRAVQEDLDRIDDVLQMDRDLIDRWLGAAVEAFIGPRASSLYARARSLEERVRSTSAKHDGNDSSSEDALKLRRRDFGRIVRFPVALPPRFSIRVLEISGPGMSLNGSNVGIDHHLAGAPSILEWKAGDTAGLPGSIELDATIDGRAASDSVLRGRLALQGWDWASTAGDSGSVSGTIGTDVVFRVPSGQSGRVETEGSVLLSDWNDGDGIFAFIGPSTPDLGFSFDGILEDGTPVLEIRIIDDFLGEWGGMLAAHFLSDGTARARAALLNAVDADLSGLDAMVGDWTAGDREAAELDGAVDDAKRRVNRILEDMAEDAGVGSLPIGDPSDALEGLKSLF